jgi:acetyl esterase/lipase
VQVEVVRFSVHTDQYPGCLWPEASIYYFTRRFRTAPATDTTDTAYPSEREFAEGCALTGQCIRARTAACLPTPPDREHPLASPLLAPFHAALPPALIITAQCEPLRIARSRVTPEVSALKPGPKHAMR